MNFLKDKTVSKAFYIFLWICFLIDGYDLLMNLFNKSSWPGEERGALEFILYLFGGSYLKIISFFLVGIALFFHRKSKAAESPG